MSTIIVLIAAILIIAFVWSLIKETKNPHLTFSSEKVELTQEDKEWLEAPLETPPTPVAEPVEEVKLEVVTVQDIPALVETLAAKATVETTPVEAAPKKKSTKRYPSKKKPSAKK